MTAFISVKFEPDREALERSSESLSEVDLEAGRFGGATITTGGVAEATAQYVVAFLASVELIHAVADIRRLVDWLSRTYGDVRVDESGIDVLARQQIEVELGESNPLHISIVQVPDEKQYIATYRLHDRRLAILRFHYDSRHISTDVLDNDQP